MEVFIEILEKRKLITFCLLNKDCLPVTVIEMFHLSRICEIAKYSM